MSARARLYYGTDTYCVWCWGFGPSLRAFAEANADRVDIDVVPGGLLVGDRVVPVGRKERARASAERVAELCHVEFGQAFFAAVDEGSTVLDSLVAGRAFVALRALAGAGRGLDVAHALQRTWWWEGRDLHDAAVRADVARSLGVDPDEAEAAFAAPESTVRAQAEFERRKEIGIKGYPSLLLETPDGLKQVGGATSSPERLQHCFDRLIAGQEPDFDPDEEDD